MRERNGHDAWVPLRPWLSPLEQTEWHAEEALRVTLCRLAHTFRRRRTVGYAVLLLSAAVLAYRSSFSFFGGTCLDPEDVCVTTWPTRLAVLAAALVALVLGGV